MSTIPGVWKEGGGTELGVGGVFGKSLGEEWLIEFTCWTSLRITSAVLLRVDDLRALFAEACVGEVVMLPYSCQLWWRWR